MKKIEYYENSIGIDEVGRGCLAGPVVAAAVVLPKNFEKFILKDSKKLSFKQVALKVFIYYYRSNRNI